MGCASTKSSHVTTTVAPVVDVCQGTQSENVVNGLEPPPVIIEGERPPNLIEETMAMTKGIRPTEIASNFCRPGNETSLQNDITNALREVQLVAPAPNINGSSVSVTLTPDEVDENALKELLEERTPVKVVVKQTTDWMKHVTTTTSEEFQRIAQSTSDNPSEILHMTSFEPNNPSSSESSSTSADEFEEMTIDQKLDMGNDKLEKAG